MLIERFDAELLDAVAGSDKMKMMRAEFKKLNEKMETTEQWARPLLDKFEDLFDPILQIYDNSFFCSILLSCISQKRLLETSSHICRSSHSQQQGRGGAATDLARKGRSAHDGRG